jgi:hypothetical protein
MLLMTSRRGLAIELAAAALILRYGAKRVGKWFSDRQFDGLEGIPGSSRVCAQHRCMPVCACVQSPLWTVCRHSQLLLAYHCRLASN